MYDVSQTCQKKNISLNIPDSQIFHKNAYDISSRSINLPSFHDITEAQMSRVTGIIVDLINSRK